MSSHEREPPLTEPKVVATIYMTGIKVDDGGHVLRFTGWELMDSEDEATAERRVVLRFAMPIDEARKLMRELAKKLPGREN